MTTWAEEVMSRDVHQGDNSLNNNLVKPRSGKVNLELVKTNLFKNPKKLQAQGEPTTCEFQIGVSFIATLILWNH